MKQDEKKKEKLTWKIKNEWRNDPSNWYLWVFYFNKKDKRLFVHSRWWYGENTINFANPFSFLALVIIIVLILYINS